MKKALLVLTLVSSSIFYAQRIQQGEMQLNGGIGFSSSGWGVPVYAGIDYGVHPDISVGLQASYMSQTYSANSYGDYKGTWIGIGANANYHFNTVLNIPDEWDVYGGLTLAYNSFSYDYPNGYSGVNTASGVGLNGQIGARYYFSEKLGVNVEFGGGNIASGGKLGITLKL